MEVGGDVASRGLAMLDMVSFSDVERRATMGTSYPFR
jgi:hypothetical protein